MHGRALEAREEEAGTVAASTALEVDGRVPGSLVVAELGATRSTAERTGSPPQIPAFKSQPLHLEFVREKAFVVVFVVELRKGAF